MNYGKRPTCRECGKPDLKINDQFVFMVIDDFGKALINSNGFGSWSLNTSIIDKICDEWQVDSPLELIRRILIVLKIIFKEEKGDK